MPYKVGDKVVVHIPRSGYGDVCAIVTSEERVVRPMEYGADFTVIDLKLESGELVEGISVGQIREATQEKVACDFDCPKCSAPEHSFCRTATGYTARTHVARWRAAGITEPSATQLHDNYTKLRAAYLSTVIKRGY